MVDEQTPAGPTPATPGEPPRQGMSGCAKAAIIGALVIFLIGGVIMAILFFGLVRFVNDASEAFEEAPCPFLTDAAASQALGVEVTAISGTSGLATMLGILRDGRLIGDAPYCFVSDEGSEVQVWVSAYEGADAAEVFAAGADVADGQVVSQETSDDGTLTVGTDAFRGEDVPGLGDEAFCVEVGPTVSGGVFARSGNRVVFVTALTLAENEGVDVFDGSLCARATPLAEALLAAG